MTRTKTIVVLLSLVAILFGAYWLWERYEQSTTSAGADSQTAFVIAEAGERSLDGAPALALTVSQPLDPRQSYDKFIQVFEMPPRKGEGIAKQDSAHDEGEDESSTQPSKSEVSIVSTDIETKGGTVISGAWVVGENPRLLFFPHIKPQTRYVVRITPGLSAKSGAALAVEARYSVRSGAVSPAYYFASRGTVLPAKQNGGLPIVTVNVPEVDIQFLRVKNDQLPAFLDQVISGPRSKSEDTAESDEEDGDYRYNRIRSLRGAVSNYELDNLRGMTESVYLGRFLAEQRANRRGVTFIPVEHIKELQEPGVYIAVMSQPNRFRYDFQTTYFYVSDLGMHLRVFPKAADTFVNSLTTGKGVTKVEVSWLDQQGKILARAETDSDGRATFAEKPKGAKIVVARKEQQVSLIALKEPALDLSEYDVVGLPYKPVRLFAYSGRNLYRPGESFDLSVMARDADGKPVQPQPIQAVLKRPDGKTQYSVMWEPEATFAGYYRKRVDLPLDSPTGFWSLELRSDPADKVPGTVFRFGVEEFLPERMKLDLSTASPFLSADKPFSIDIRGAYLYGAPAEGNRLLGVAQYERNRNPLASKLPGFEFGDADEDSVKIRKELEEGSLDATGAADVDIDLAPVAKRRSPFLVRATLSLLESGGRPVVRSVERTYWPAATLIGIRPLFVGDYAPENSPVQFEVVRTDTDANLKSAVAFPVRLFRENRNYYWRFDDQRGWNSGFTETDELVETLSISIPAGGRGKLMLPVRYGRYRVEILDPETKQTLRYRFYAGWSAKSDETQGIRPDRVALKFDKPAYREGDSAVLTFTPPHAGEALITVEGDRTFWMKRMSVPHKASTIRIPIAKEWQRHDLYVSVMVLRPGNEGDRVTPARALGVVHLPLQRDERKLNVVLNAPKKMRPDGPLKVKVKVADTKGQKAVVTVSAVDVGILNITRYATPDPYGFFFGKLRYGADQHDVYGRLIEKMAGQRGRLKFGGDNTPKATKSLPKKLKLVDLFSGPVALDQQGEAEITLPIPDFNGTLRLMAVVGEADRFGSQEAEVTVAAPLVAELAAPRFLTIGDNTMIALDLHNLSGAAQQLKVSLTSNEGLAIQDAERTVSLKDQQRTTIRFATQTGSAFGLTNVNVKVEGRELSLERSFPLNVQAPSPQQHVTRRYQIKPGETLEIKDAELAGFHKQTALAHITLSNKPPIDVRSAIQGLLTYPYGCTEQTTSTAYPHVFIDEEAARAFGLRPYTREQRAEMLEKAIGRLTSMQSPNGGFSLWGNLSEYEYWISSYVANFLQDAREQGFNVPEQTQKKVMDFLLRALQEGVGGLPPVKPQQTAVWTDAVWNDRYYGGLGRFGVLSYGAYVLARESKAPVSTLRQLYESRALAHSGLSLVHLGIALRLMGDEERGNTAIGEGVRKGRSGDYWWGDYGSPLRDAALSYALLIKHQINVEGRENLTGVIGDEITKHRHYSTQEKMAIFLAGRSFTTSDSETWSVDIATKGKPDSVSTTGSHLRELPVRDLASGIKLTNTHKEVLYAELALSGHPVKMPPAQSDPIALKREMYNADGTAIGNRPLKAGETVIVRLNVKTRWRIANGLVVDRIPAGLEVENLNIVQGEKMGTVKIGNVNPVEAMADRRIQHVEFREDRFAAAVKLDGEMNLFYRARVVTPGKFLIPPLYAEDMYRPDTFGLVGGSEVITVMDGRSGEGEKAAASHGAMNQTL